MRYLRAALGNRPLLLGLALFMGVLGARGAFKSGLTPPDVRQQRPDEFDVDMLKKGLDQTPDLSDTPRWFTGYWIGCNPFWRPGSSYIFWTLHKVLGWEHHDRYEIVRGVCHVIVSGMLFWLVMVLTGRPLLGLLTVAMQNVHVPLPLIEHLYTAQGVGAVQRWISMPDQWLAMVALPALWLAWRGAIWWAVPLAAAAAMIKETGFVVFPLIMLFYWWRHRRLHPAFLALVGIAAIFAALKLSYVGPGWILGSNRSIWTRIFRFVAPEPVNQAATGNAPWSVLGVVLGVAVIVWFSGKRREWLAIGIAGAGFVAAVLVYALFIGASGGAPGLDIALAGVVERRLLYTSLVMAVWTLAAYAGLRGPDRWLVVLLVIAHLVLGLPGKIAPQAGTRSMYTARLLSTAISAICLWSLPLIVGFRVRQRPVTEHLSQTGERATACSEARAETDPAD